MSQLPPPSPYQPPPQQQFPMSFDYYQPADVLSPARRAAVMTFAVGVMLLVGAFCCAGIGAMAPQMMAQNPAAFESLQEQMPGLSTDTLRVMFIVLAVIVAGLGIGVIVLGVFVRRASRPAVIVTMVLSSLMVLYLAFNLVRSLFLGRQAPAEIAGVMCMMALPTLLLAVQIYMLYQALPSTDRASALREQHMQQYWRYAYQQQMYAMQQQQPGGPPASQPIAPPPPQQFWRPTPTTPPEWQPPPPPPPGDSDAPPPSQQP